MRSRGKWFLLVLLCFAIGQSASSRGTVPLLRVGLVQHQPSVSFTPSGGAVIASLRLFGPKLSVPTGETWTVQPAAARLRVLRADGAEAGLFSSPVRISTREGDTVIVHGVPGHWDGITDRAYRGVIEVRLTGRDLGVVNLLDVETYLRGVVPSEMPSEYPLAALQAQAVAARGQAIVKSSRHRAEGFGPCSGPHCQVYGGAISERPSTDEAVTSTRGQVLTYQGRIADTLYSSNCGGHTANNEDYWSGARPIPYLRGAPDCEAEGAPPFPHPLSGDDLARYLKYAPRVNCNAPQYAQSEKIRWWEVVPRAQLEADLRGRLGDFGRLLGMRVLARADSGMVTQLLVVGTKRAVRLQGGAKTRAALHLDSPSFAVEPVLGGDGTPAAYVIWGAGWGHQVGMCQVGAAGLAEKGWDYQHILAKYYQGTKVEKRY